MGKGRKAVKVLVTGSAGFIGFHVARRLLAAGHDVLGLDGFTAYYDVALKRARHAELEALPRFTPCEAMLEDEAAVAAAIAGCRPEIVIHLAAQAGVRHSLENPLAYASANVTGTITLLEALRAHPPRHLLFASSSSVYGGNTKLPFAETDRTDFPASPYAATKKAGEALTHAYAHLYGVPTTGFRFFTVYGPWGRPDMALFRFVAAIAAGSPIEVYGEGRLERDFTYIDDLVEAIIRLVDVPPVPGAPVAVPGGADSLSPIAPWRVVNIAASRPVGLLPFIETVEAALGRPAIRHLLPAQPGDVAVTWADPALLHALVGTLPHTPIATGVGAFVTWYRAWAARRGDAP
jgi:UDP-glucuronate 4-epimerase